MPLSSVPEDPVEDQCRRKPTPRIEHALVIYIDAREIEHILMVLHVLLCVTRVGPAVQSKTAGVFRAGARRGDRKDSAKLLRRVRGDIGADCWPSQKSRS